MSSEIQNPNPEKLRGNDIVDWYFGGRWRLAVVTDSKDGELYLSDGVRLLKSGVVITHPWYAQGRVSLADARYTTRTTPYVLASGVQIVLQ